MTGLVDPVDQAARDDFSSRYDTPAFGPVTVVIPAYREEATIGAVVREVPASVLGLAVTILVIVDGAEDDSASVAAAAGAYVCATSVNRGQGAALRLGYHVAVEHGARYLVSLDADGQYDPAEIETVLRPIVDGDADFVSGSRRLGANHQQDNVRRAGVVVYASLITLLTHHRVTDPSFGLRAMRAEVALAVTLTQPQFQASELLIGALMRGFRVAERPAVMRRRAGGTSRKGPNLVYGYRFGRVVVGTWRRERRASTSTRRAR